MDGQSIVWRESAHGMREKWEFVPKVGQDKNKFKFWTIGGYKALDMVGLP